MASVRLHVCVHFSAVQYTSIHAQPQNITGYITQKILENRFSLLLFFTYVFLLLFSPTENPLCVQDAGRVISVPCKFRVEWHRGKWTCTLQIWEWHPTSHAAQPRHCFRAHTSRPKRRRASGAGHLQQHAPGPHLCHPAAGPAVRVGTVRRMAAEAG